jgi:polyisoprenoid-binding protein YceI
MAYGATDIEIKRSIITACTLVKVNEELLAVSSVWMKITVIRSHNSVRSEFFRYQQNTVYKPHDAKKSYVLVTVIRSWSF